MKKATPKAQEADAKLYGADAGGSRDAQGLQGRAGKQTRGPRLKVTVTGKERGRCRRPPSRQYLNRGRGAHARPRNDGFRASTMALIGQLINASKEKGKPRRAARISCSPSSRGSSLRDQIEAMLGAQMAAVHMASMTFARRLAHVDTISQQDSASECLQKASAHIRHSSGRRSRTIVRRRAEDDGSTRPRR